MEAFLKKEEYNYIKKRLKDLNNALRTCNDYRTRDASRDYIQDKILSHLSHLLPEQKKLLDITALKDSHDIDVFLNQLQPYIFTNPPITASEISKLFKKEKKLKLPSSEVLERPCVYLGWFDLATKKLFIVHRYHQQLLGMACRLTEAKNKQTNVCALCHHMGPKSKVAFVSPLCKGNKNYRSIGFFACLDSAACNERITSTEKLEGLLKEVNNIK